MRDASTTAVTKAKKGESLNLVKSIIAVFILAVSFLVLIGWLLDIPRVLYILPGSATMKANTALMFVLSGLALLVCVRETSYRWPDYLIGSILLLICGATLLEYILQINFGIDNLIIEDNRSRRYPGRMSVGTAVCFMIIGGCILCIHLENDYVKKGAQFALFIVLLTALISLGSYLFRVPGTERTIWFETMSIHTSILFVLTTIGLSMINPKKGFIGLLAGDYPGSKLMRLMMPFVILITLGLSYGFLAYAKANGIDLEFAFAAFSIVFLVLSIAYLAAVSEGLNASARKDDFLKIVTHELRSPLTATLAYQELALGLPEEKNKEIKDCIKKAHNSSQKIQHLCDDLSDLVHIKEGKIPFNLTKFDIKQLIRSVVYEIERIYPTHKVVLEGGCDASFVGDEGRINQLITNLLSNAIKYSPDENRVMLMYECNQEIFRLKVQDFGIGMSSETVHNIFRKFYRAEHGGRYSGSGLGMFISKEILDFHNGTIKIKSQLNEGSTVTVEMPMNR